MGVGKRDRDEPENTGERRKLRRHLHRRNYRSVPVGVRGEEPVRLGGDHRAMPAEAMPILYVKTGCPWCHDVVEYLKEHGITYRERNVSSDAGARQEMQQKSGQDRAPTLDWHGKILADFGVDELVPFLRSQNVKLEDS